jgi:hypothetical protein
VLSIVLYLNLCASMSATRSGTSYVDRVIRDAELDASGCRHPCSRSGPSPRGHYPTSSNPKPSTLHLPVCADRKRRGYWKASLSSAAAVVCTAAWDDRAPMMSAPAEGEGRTYRPGGGRAEGAEEQGPGGREVRTRRGHLRSSVAHAGRRSVARLPGLPAARASGWPVSGGVQGRQRPRTRHSTPRHSAPHHSTALRNAVWSWAGRLGTCGDLVCGKDVLRRWASRDGRVARGNDYLLGGAYDVCSSWLRRCCLAQMKTVRAGRASSSAHGLPSGIVSAKATELIWGLGYA